MKKAFKVITLLMLVILVVTAFAMPADAKQVFTDLSPEHWCYSKIMDFEKKGYVCGYSDDTFRADRTITRAEYVKIVNNFFGYKPSEKTTSAFKDVNSGDWFMPYVNAAVDIGYIEGFEDGTFRPQDPIRRQEATVILARILKIDEEVYPADHKDGLAQYSDSDEVQEWARVAIHSYSVYNFINGYEDGTLRILRNVTRAETVELLNTLEQKVVIDRKSSGGTKTKTSTLKPDIDVLVRKLIEVPIEDEIVVEEEYIPAIYTKSNWINKKNSTFEKETAKNGAFVNITSQTTGAKIHDTVDLIERKAEYTTTKRDEYDNIFFLTDGVYTVTAQATKTGKKDSAIENKVIKIDTVAPIVNLVATSSASGEIAHEQSITIAVKDINLYNTNEISGLDKVAYAWFNADTNERVTVWSAFELTDGQAQINAPLTYGKYKLGIAAIDVAENTFGTQTEYAVKSEDISGDVPTTPSGDVDYDFVKETESGDENPSGEEIIVIVGNNNPTVENLTMYTTVNKSVSGELKGKDVDSGDILSYELLENATSGEATVNDNITTFVSNKAGTYNYTVKVKDNHSGEAIGNVTVYVFDAKVKATDGNTNYDVLANGITLYIGEEKDLTASVIPSGEAEYVWQENADEIDIEGTNKNDVVTIKGKVPGETEMTVKALINGVEIEKTISVTVKGRKLTIHYVYAEDDTKAHEDHIIDGVDRNGYNVVSPKIKGYTPDREVVSGDMLTSDKEETVRYTRDTAKYSVKYYTETLTSGEYELKESGEKIGATGDTVTIDTSKEFEGFTFDSNNTNNLLSGDVLTNGELTLKAYYSRNEYTLNLISGDNIAEVTGSGKYKYGEKVTIDAKMENKLDYTYEFKSWKSGEEVYSKSRSLEVEIKDNMTLKAFATATKKAEPKLAIETFATDKKDGKEIDEFIYDESGDNTYWYVIKGYNTKKDSYPATIEATITDELPSYLEFISGETESGTIEVSKNSNDGKCTITWNAKDIGYDESAQYAYIKVRVNKDAFKQKEVESGTERNTISNIVANMTIDKKEKWVGYDYTGKTYLFIRDANPADPNAGDGYLFAGEASAISETGLNVVGGARYIGDYTDAKIGEILQRNDETEIQKMLEDFTNNQSDVTQYISESSKITTETVKNNIDKIYNGAVKISDTQWILWYKFMKTGDSENSGYTEKRTYTIENKEAGTTTKHTIEYYPNSYHLDGIVVDIRNLTTIPDGAQIVISNTAEEKENKISATSEVKLYYKTIPTDDVKEDEVQDNISGEKQNIDSESTLITSGETKENNNSQAIVSGDIEIKNNDEVNYLETVSSGEMVTDSKNEKQEENVDDNNENQVNETKDEQNQEENQEGLKFEENNNEEMIFEEKNEPVVVEEKQDDDDNQTSNNDEDEQNDSNEEKDENKQSDTSEEDKESE